jgi:HK97 family phage prohead protease
MGWKREFRKGGQPEKLTGALLLSDVKASAKDFSRLRGRAVSYNTFVPRGFYQLQITPGSLDKSINEAGGRLPLLLFHNWESFPIGSALDWTSTKSHLDAEWEIWDTEEAQKAARAAHDGHLTGLSIGMSPILSAWEFNEDAEWPVTDLSQLDKMTVVEGRLFETSLTPAPAFNNARVSHVFQQIPAQRDTPTPRLDAWKKYAQTLHMPS